MRCARCAGENPPAAKFCSACGSRLEARRPACGHPNAPGARFCNECGQPLEGAEAPAASAAFASPQSYTPRHLVERVLTSRSALEGERKQVTVLFVDVVGSSGLAERLDPETMHQLMDRALRLMADTVHRYQGTVNQFLGDGLMALFGAPLALEDHALRAVEAALAIRETVSGYSEQLRHELDVEMRLRLGLNSGLVVVGKIGDDLRMDYTAVGDTTHLAARMQEVAEPGTILVTGATHRLVEGYVTSEPLGPVEVRGRREPVTVFRVTGRRHRRSRLEVSADVGLTALIGRQRELGILQECFERARNGRGQVVGIVGDAGVGKSRLLYEFRRSLEGERVTWLEGHCLPYRQATPYVPLLEVFKANFLIEDGDNPLQAEEKLRRGIRQLDPDLERVLPFLRELCGLPSEDETAKHLDPKDRRQKIFEALLAVHFAGARKRPQVFIFEDLHWIDRTSEEYLALLVERLASLPTLLLTTYRPEYTVPWPNTSTQLALELLDERQVETMIAGLLGIARVPAELVRVVWEKAEGNPLFIEEILRSLRDRGLVDMRHGELVWRRDDQIEVPGTVQDIIRARLDRLEEPVKRTAQTAAVIGREFGLTVLSGVAEQSQELPRHLDALKRLELIHETRFFPELEYIFTHAVIQDVAYHTLLIQRRKELHGAIAGAIEVVYANRLEETAPILAYHYSRSERQDRAVAYTLLAGDRAARLYANAEATSYYEHALAMARALPASPDARRAVVDAIVRLAAVGVTRQDVMERDWQNLEEARAVAEDLGDAPRLARVLYWLGRSAYVRWQPSSAIAYARRSLEIAEGLGDESLAAPPVNLMGRIYWQQSEYEKASQLLERSAEQMRRLGNKTEEATAAGFAGFTLGLMGEFDRALTYVEHGLRLAQEIGNPFAEAALALNRAIVWGERGEWDVALADFERARQTAERVGDVFRIFVVKFFEGRVHTMAGNPGRGRALIEESLALSQQIGTRFALAWQKSFLAHALLALGEPDRVPALCEEAIRLADEMDDRFPSAFAHRTLAEALVGTHPPEPAKAETHVLEAIRIYREIGTRPELARSYVTCARLLHAEGRRDQAAELLKNARALFREMGMAKDVAATAALE
jgi:predicted ATPase/class 3 adenylate cyclase